MKDSEDILVHDLSNMCTPEGSPLHDCSPDMPCLEEQFEVLNSSLIALTTHFAQVQFRLRQIVDAAPEEKEILLKNLEEFAFRGIPDVNQTCFDTKRLSSDVDSLEETLTQQKAKQSELIDRLKRQLADLESYAYDAGDGGPPQNVIIEKQKVIIDQLRDQLNLNIDQIDQMSLDDLKKYVNSALNEVINPLKMKEQLVVQLKTQLSDLERYIHFLQVESNDYISKMSKCKCSCQGCNHNVSRPDQLPGKMLNIVRRISALLQIFATTHFHTTKKFYKNSPKRSQKIKHWGDLRAQLEIAVEAVADLAGEPEPNADSDYVSDSESVAPCAGKLTSAVRKQLAAALQNLLQHGLVGAGQSLSLVPFVACFRGTTTPPVPAVHPWELFLRYYEMKNGDQFNAAPARRLSQSFNLDISGSRSVSSKQALLSAIGHITETHEAFKKGYDTRFKALVCAALNRKMLVAWLKLVLRCQPILEMYFADWSYVVKTGFEDTFHSLEKLNKFHFNLPVDHAIRKLNDIKDAF